MKPIFYTAIVILSASMAGCSKSSSSTPSKTKTELITQASWKYNTATVDADKNGTGETALPAGLLEACITDNIITFKSDLTGTGDEGAAKCAPGDPQTVAFTWGFKNNETIISVTSPTPIFNLLSGDVTLNSIDANKMVVTVKDYAIASTTVNIIVELKH